ncbi:hypothetical protein EWB00_011160 [Schistosoma japonicum]|uniref:Uncharacterized protein n=1 Tax=Schistosoma japonicum TaxID=6182 RepID=A0A4Z2DLR8_SCHJA|nr:hypothetical protein EWB00_011160 [Schistosoma japonicum]
MVGANTNLDCCTKDMANCTVWGRAFITPGYSKSLQWYKMTTMCFLNPGDIYIKNTYVKSKA